MHWEQTRPLLISSILRDRDSDYINISNGCIIICALLLFAKEAESRDDKMYVFCLITGCVSF